MEDEKALQAVLDQYGVGTLRSCRRPGCGYVNETWVVDTDDGTYVVRRRHPLLARSKAIEAQHALIRHLVRCAFPAPRVVCDRRGATFVIHHERCYELYEYLAGDSCDPLCLSHLSAAADVLGRYHTAVSGFDHVALHRAEPRYGPSILARTVRRLRYEWHDEVDDHVRSLLAVLEHHVEQLQELVGDAGALPELVIHGDYYAENLIFRDERVVGVLDYDQAHWCSRVMEVAEALIYFAQEREGHLEHIVYSGALDLALVRPFLAAYGGQICLTDAEIHVLPHLVRTIWLCAALDPPLLPRMRAQQAPDSLPEVLYLAEWAAAHASELVEAALTVRSHR